MRRRPPRSTQSRSSAASDVYKRQIPLTKYSQLERFVNLSRASVPPAFLEQLESNRYNPEAVYKAGMDFAIRQCRDLLMLGAPGLHFYTLNKSRATVEIYQTLMVR